ncbi:uncharacterized protein BDCG_16559 [Blastomyces dermatitidis ER-3]|uniref:Uncharacterized protein n=1 Tax=Ajellomyces dermatitidis (strain ER-3 / ATCC MYA-2586) TaxID=559297 RepID=A0ABX2VST5_AJEDR|nr:uncharacterized protein BDCG_16559 [Blastomyces dermatitidis ER-3]OAT00279.1 hypothetical protein BDCG_16559 [Blastomyces dermatitidis ER-3]
MKSINIALKALNITISAAEKIKIEIEKTKLNIEKTKLELKKKKVIIEKIKLKIERSRLTVQYEILITCNEKSDNSYNSLSIFTADADANTDANTDISATAADLALSPFSDVSTLVDSLTLSSSETLDILREKVS